ncbi:MAG: hypothetical protein IH584_01045, partial [Candidatus Aminicenantes bacterium]|nr:hypothetical protein [Candidatus Aminicenantes bacterium]
DSIPWQGGHWPQLLLAVLAAAFFGYLALGMLKRIMIREKFYGFGMYLLAAGILTLLFL